MKFVAESVLYSNIKPTPLHHKGSHEDTLLHSRPILAIQLILPNLSNNVPLMFVRTD